MGCRGQMRLHGSQPLGFPIITCPGTPTVPWVYLQKVLGTIYSSPTLQGQGDTPGLTCEATALLFHQVH